MVTSRSGGGGGLGKVWGSVVRISSLCHNKEVARYVLTSRYFGSFIVNTNFASLVHNLDDGIRQNTSWLDFFSAVTESIIGV